MRFSIDSNHLAELLSTQDVIGSPDETHPGYLSIGIGVAEGKVWSWASNGTAATRIARAPISVEQAGAIGIPILHANMMLSMLGYGNGSEVSVSLDRERIKFSFDGKMYKTPSVKAADVPPFKLPPTGIQWKKIEAKKINYVYSCVAPHVCDGNSGFSVFAGVNLASTFSQATNRHALVRINTGILDGEAIVLPGALRVPFLSSANMDTTLAALAAADGSFWLRTAGAAVRSSMVSGEYPNESIEKMVSTTGAVRATVSASALATACSRMSAVCRDQHDVPAINFKPRAKTGDVYMVPHGNQSGFDAAEKITMPGATPEFLEVLSKICVSASLLGKAAGSVSRACAPADSVTMFLFDRHDRIILEGVGAIALVMPLSTS